MRYVTNILVWVTIFIELFVSCGIVPPPPPLEGYNHHLLNSCKTDSNCGEGSICSAELNSCITPFDNVERLELYLEVFPKDQENNKYYLLQRLEIEPNFSSPLTIEISEPVKVEGSITYEIEDGTQKYVEAVVTFKPLSSTFRTPQFEVNSSPSPIGVNNNYSIELPPGKYDIIVEAVGEEWKDVIPPYYEYEVVLSSGNTYNISHVYKKDNLREIVGVLEIPEIVTGRFQIVAFDIKTGKRISTVGTVDCGSSHERRYNCGWFSLLIEKNHSEFGLRIIPEQSNHSTRYLPIIEISGFDFNRADQNQDERISPEELTSDGVIFLSELGYIVKFRGKIVGSDGTPINGARVNISSKEVLTYGLQEQIKLDISLYSDEGGSFELPLLPGNYQLNIDPGEASDFSGKTFNLEIPQDKTEMEQQFPLPLKSVLNLQVYSGINGIPVVEADVRLVHLSLGSYFTTKIEEELENKIDVTEGEYLLTVIPPRESVLPWYVTKLFISGSDSQEKTQNNVVIVLPPPYRIQGVIVSKNVDLNYIKPEINLYYPVTVRDETSLVQIGSTDYDGSQGDFSIFFKEVDPSLISSQ